MESWCVYSNCRPTIFSLVEKIVTNTYFSGVACSIIAVIIIYKWQVLYSKRKLKQDFRCNECIEGIYDGIEAVRKYMPLVPEKEKWDRVCDYEEFRKKMQRNILTSIGSIKVTFILQI